MNLIRADTCYFPFGMAGQDLIFTYEIQEVIEKQKP